MTRLFVDLDGTAAEWKKIKTLEEIFEKDYFFNLAPHKNVCEGLRILSERFPEIEIYVLSAVSEGAIYAVEDKNRWVDKFLPFIPKERRIFSVCGQNKADFIPGGIKKTDFLLDDYSFNLHGWNKSGGTGIKLINNCNNTKKTWKGKKVSYKVSPYRIMGDLAEIILK